MGISASNPKGVDQPAQPRFGRMDVGLDRITEGVSRAKDWLFGQQHPDGYWCGELEADSMLESDYIFMHTLLGTGEPGRMERAINEILRHQNDDGGWGLFPGGAIEYQLWGQGLSCSEADGVVERSSSAGEGT